MFKTRQQTDSRRRWMKWEMRDGYLWTSTSPNASSCLIYGERERQTAEDYGQCLTDDSEAHRRCSPFVEDILYCDWPAGFMRPTVGLPDRSTVSLMTSVVWCSGYFSELMCWKVSSRALSLFCLKAKHLTAGCCRETWTVISALDETSA